MTVIPSSTPLILFTSLFCCACGQSRPEPTLVAPVTQPVSAVELEEPCDEVGLERIVVTGGSLEIVRFSETYEDTFREGASFTHDCAGLPDAACESAARSAARVEYPSATGMRVVIDGDAIGFVSHVEVDGQVVTLHPADHHVLAAHLRQLSDAGHDALLVSSVQEFAPGSTVAHVSLEAPPVVVNRPNAELRLTLSGDSPITEVLTSLVEALEASDYLVQRVEPLEGYVRVNVQCEVERRAP